MRNTLFASVALVGLALAAPAFSQTAPATPPDTATGARPGNVIGTGNSEPSSNRASNISSGDTASVIAPRLPVPPVGPDAGPRELLTVAQSALQRHRTGEAQEALERAETRLLDRSTAPSDASTPDQSAMVKQITDARMALSHGDTAQAGQIISQALAGAGGGGAMGSSPMSNGMSAGAGAMGTETKPNP